MFNFSRFAVRTIAVLLPSCALPLAASAQTRADEPDTTLRLTLSTFAGYETDVSTSGFASEAAPSAVYGGGRATMRYRVRNNKIAFGANGSADSRYYHTDDPFGAASYSGNAQFSSDLTSRLNITSSVNALYSPQFVFSVLPTATDVDLDLTPALDYGVRPQRMVSYAAGATLRFQTTRRSFVTASATGGSQNMLDENYDVRTRGVGGGYSYSVSRHATVRAGYREHVSEYPTSFTAQSKRFTQRAFDVGVNYSRPLSVSRRTTLSFGTGSSAYDDEEETYYAVTGNAALTHQIGRTWETSVTYARGLSIVGGFSEPFFADAVQGNLQGQLTRALAAIVSAGFSNGSVGLGPAGDNFDSMHVTGRLEWVARNDRVGIYGNYFYHAYEFDEAPPSAFFVPGNVDRHGVSAGLIFRIPLLRERTTRVTR